MVDLCIVQNLLIAILPFFTYHYIFKHYYFCDIDFLLFVIHEQHRHYLYHPFYFHCQKCYMFLTLSTYGIFAYWHLFYSCNHYGL